MADTGNVGNVLFWGHAGVLASVYEAELDDAHCLKLMGGIMACPGGQGCVRVGTYRLVRLVNILLYRK